MLMTRSFLPVFALLALVISTGTGCGPSDATSTRRPTPTPTTSRYVVTLSPLNHSGVSATAQLEMAGDLLTVTIQSRGLEPNREHYQHIHGNPGSTVRCPSATDAGASGVLTVEQGLAAVGPIALDLSPYAQVSGPWPTHWSHAYSLSPEALANLSPLTGHVVVLHGMTYHGTYDRALFVACGPIKAA
jgi:hypothetical protein